MPLHWPLIALCLLLLADCHNPPEVPESHSLSVGATVGLSSFEPGPSAGGSSAAALPLIFEEIERYVGRTEVRGRSTILHLRADSSRTVEELANSFRYKTLVSAKPVNRNTIEVTFSDTESARTVATLCCGGFALGPFELKTWSGTTAVLTRKEKHAIQEIFLQEISDQDEWRLFLGRELDLIPNTSSLYRKQLEQMASVTVVDYPSTHKLGLFFNTNKEDLAAPTVRRQLAHLIDRKALATILFGDQTKSIEGLTSPPEVPPTFSRSLQLAYLSQDTNLKRSAEIIRFQLMEFGINISLVPLDIMDFMAFCVQGSFDLALLPVPNEKRRYDLFLSKQRPRSTNFTGYESDEFEKAYDADNAEQLDTILTRDMPFTLLYTQSSFAAFDSRLCLSQEPRIESWLWMASLHPCEGDGHQ